MTQPDHTAEPMAPNLADPESVGATPVEDPAPADALPTESIMPAPVIDKPKIQSPMPEKIPADLAPLKIEVADLKIPEDKRRPYWVGLTEDCPVDVATVAGICFQKGTEQVISHGAQTARIPNRGHIVRVDDEKLRRLKADAARKILRPEGGGWSIADTAGSPAKPFRPLDGDIHLARFMFCVPVMDGQQFVRDGRVVETMLPSLAATA